MSDNFFPLVVADVRPESTDSVSVAFAVPDDLRDKFAFTPGQHIVIKADVNGEECRRNYSLCVAPRDEEWRVAIRRVAGGRFSNWANDNIRAGDTLAVAPPHGSFTYRFDPAHAHLYAGFAGGSGITPILSLLKTALAEEPQSRFVLCYGNRATANVMFLEQLAELKDLYLDRFQLIHILEQEEDEIALFNGRLDAEKLGQLFPAIIDPAEIDAAFICGPAPMMEAVSSTLRMVGVPEDHILVEHFLAEPPSADQLAAMEKLKQQSSGRSVTLVMDGRRRLVEFDPAKGSILENARAAGLPAPFACKAGVCATCRARVVEGEVAMAVNYGLSKEETDHGYVLTCQSIPLTDKVVLDYDG